MSGAIILDESIGDYHANASVSNTGLREFEKLGPKGYFHRHVKRTNERTSTKALRDGQGFEDYLGGSYVSPLDGRPRVPEEIADTEGKSAGAMKPWQGNRKVCKAWLADNPGAVTPADLADHERTVEMFEHMRKAVQGNATAMSLLDGAQEQLTLRSPFPGLPAGVQSRPDFFKRDDFMGNVFIDLKTTDSLDLFKRSVHRFGYAKQAGLCMYNARQAGIEDPRYYLLAVEKEFPTRCMVYPLSARTLATGEKWCMQQLAALAEHYESDHWPSTVDEVEELDAPVWGVELDEGEAA